MNLYKYVDHILPLPHPRCCSTLGVNETTEAYIKHREEGNVIVMMGSVTGETVFVPKTISDFLREVSVIGDVAEKVSRVNNFLDGLEEEIRRIDASKRELPLCRLLLRDAIMVLKEDSMQGASLNKVLLLEELIPSKKTSGGEDNALMKRTDSKDMKNWMSSVQLWNTEDDVHYPGHTFEAKQNLKLASCKTNQDIFLTYNSRSTAGAVSLFNSYTSLSRMEEESPGPGLSLFTPGNNNSPYEDCHPNKFRDNGDREVCVSSPTTESSLRKVTLLLEQQNDRKQRRCWSPDLHRCFVNALQQLGGSQVATPKQIRELMQVDGLTNDEVKSHLQKYRLHSRRVCTDKHTIADQSILRGLWMPRAQYGDSSKPTSSLSGSPQRPLQLNGNTGGTSTTGGDSTEDCEDAKSEGYSWKFNIHR